MTRLKIRSTPIAGAEKETLRAFLNNYRAAMVWKLAGLSDEDAVRPLVLSGTNLLGLVKHLAWVELGWFVELYERHIARADAVLDAAELDDLSAREGDGKRFSLRWILIHMVEETARHAGHADIIREQIDGATGMYP